MSIKLNLSDEQLEILKAVVDHNVIVDSVAGSGKTTTILHIAKTLSDKKVLVLTYNKRLKFETRERSTDLTNLMVHSYHSFGYQCFGERCARDSGLMDVVDLKIEPNHYYSFDVLIIDECQDMTPTYYWFVKHLLKFNRAEAIQFVLIGDKRQMIYEYNEADSRYLTMGDRLFDSALPWTRLELSKSFRVPKNISQFINRALLHENHIGSISDGGIVRYIIGLDQQMIMEIKGACDKYGYDNVFILTTSLRKLKSFKLPGSEKNPVAFLANQLSALGVPVHIPLSDYSEEKDDVMKGKLVFSTFHQAKGLERKCVVILRLDNGNFSLKNDIECPNTVYVAATRAREELFIFHLNSCKALPYVQFQHFGNAKISTNVSLAKVASAPVHREVKQNEEQKLGEFKVNTLANDNFKFNIGEGRQIKHAMTVNDVIRHLPSTLVRRIMTHLPYESSTIGNKLQLPNIVDGIDDLKECISDINGTALVVNFEYAATGHAVMFKILEQNDFEDKVALFFRSPSIPLLLELTVYYHSIRDGFAVRQRQLDQYNWLDFDTLNTAFSRLSTNCGISNLKFEDKRILQYTCGPNKINIGGSIDIISGKTLWEIKCTNQTEDTHIIQLAMYALMYPELDEYKLLNVITGEIITLDTTHAKDAIHLLIHTKYLDDTVSIDDQEFINKHVKKTVVKETTIDELTDLFSDAVLFD